MSYLDRFFWLVGVASVCFLAATGLWIALVSGVHAFRKSEEPRLRRVP